MMTSLVDIEIAKRRLASGEKPYAFEMSDRVTMVGPACGYGTDYLRLLRTEGRYAASLEEATSVADSRGAAIVGIWFVRKPVALKAAK